MADASFDVQIVSARDPLEAGDQATIEIHVEVPKAHEGIALVWKVGWKAEGRRTNTTVVESGSQHIDHIPANTPQSWSIPFTVPEDGPISYRGTLLSVDWFVEVSLDIPWAFDPESTFPFEVVPRVLPARRKSKKKKRRRARV
jgi:hypothetical protein